ncbi:serine hydroxymethyltransferase, mitochondrial [Trichomonascus vanleenenianus]|uniref:glycine hydroxymethyltransferase SHM1 n=1 Tax=Trichomonascus vanleenenianus TaxID=2268995 RepID=UPI003ECB5D25
MLSLRTSSRLSRTLPLTARRAYASFTNQELISKPVGVVDKEVADIVSRERQRQKESITLIPSENYTSKAVMDVLGSEMQNKYSEGYPGARYYGGNQFIDQGERLCQQRALDAFGLSPEEWGVNVQPLSGAPANLYAYSAVMEVGDRLMGLDLPHGGHLSHGYQTPSKKISMISKYFQTMPYQLDESTGLIDFEALEKTIKLFRPKVLVAGASAYARSMDWERFRKIADSVGAYLLSDMSHTSGLVAAGVAPSPFPHSDIVTTTSHKSLRGPRGAIIFFRKGVRSVNKKGKEIMYDLEDKINFSVFPGHQGGPHNHTITALAVALGQARTPEFKEYQHKVVENSKLFADELKKLGYTLVSGGTDNHLVLIDLKPNGIDGARVETILELINIAANKNTVPGDKSALVPGGLRVGTPAMTTRGFGPEEFKKVASYIDRAVKIASEIKKEALGKGEKTKLADFRSLAEGRSDVEALKKEVTDFVSAYPVPGEL